MVSILYSEAGGKLRAQSHKAVIASLRPAVLNQRQFKQIHFSDHTTAICGNVMCEGATPRAGH